MWKLLPGHPKSTSNNGLLGSCLKFEPLSYVFLGDQVNTGACGLPEPEVEAELAGAAPGAAGMAAPWWGGVLRSLYGSFSKLGGLFVGARIVRALLFGLCKVFWGLGSMPREQRSF